MGHMPVFPVFGWLVSLSCKQTSTQSNTVTRDKAIPEREKREEEEGMRDCNFAVFLKVIFLPRKMSWCGALTEPHCSESAWEVEPESALGPKTEEQ